MGTNWRDANKRQAIYDWEAETFDAVISGVIPSALTTTPRVGHRRALYITANYYYHLPANNFEDMREWAEGIGLASVDDMLTHISIDYIPQCYAVRNNGDGWAGMDKFFA